ncbi:hypothetical protein D3C80_2097440 [compost metagenome]
MNRMLFIMAKGQIPFQLRIGMFIIAVAQRLVVFAVIFRLAVVVMKRGDEQVKARFRNGIVVVGQFAFQPLFQRAEG